MRLILTIGFAVTSVLLFSENIAGQRTRCDVPPKKGTVYIVVKYRPYDSRRPNAKTNVKIFWGPNKFDRNFPSFSLTQPTVGVVIAARHNNDDSVPLFIETDGTFQMCRQLDRPPSYQFYEQARW